MKPALNRGLRKAARTLLQLAAAGGLTALVDLAAHGLAPEQAAAVMIVWGTLVAFLHNFLETKGVIGALLPTPGLVTTAPAGAVGKVVGTVDTVAQRTATTAVSVVGDVVNTAGEVVGGVAGAAGGLLKGVEDLGGV